jgi:hypothetical protein
MEVLEGIAGQLKIIKKAQSVSYRSFPVVFRDQVALIEAPFSLKDLIEKSPPPESVIFIVEQAKTTAAQYFIVSFIGKQQFKKEIWYSLTPQYHQRRRLYLSIYCVWLRPSWYIFSSPVFSLFSSAWFFPPLAYEFC